MDAQFFTVYVHFWTITPTCIRKGMHVSQRSPRECGKVYSFHEYLKSCRVAAGWKCTMPPQGTLEFSILCRWIALINETIWPPKMLFSTASGDYVCTMKVYDKKIWSQNPNILEIDADPARKIFRKMLMLSA